MCRIVIQHERCRADDSALLRIAPERAQDIRPSHVLCGTVPLVHDVRSLRQGSVLDVVAYRFYNDLARRSRIAVG